MPIEPKKKEYKIFYSGYSRDTIILSLDHRFMASEIRGKFSFGSVMYDDFSFVFYGDSIFRTPRIEAGEDVRFWFPVNQPIQSVRLIVRGITQNKLIILEAVLK